MSDDLKSTLETCKCWLHKAWEFIKMCASWVAEKLHLSEWAEYLCGKIHNHVEHFHPGDLELGSQNLRLKTCAADTGGFQPLLWTEEE